MIVLENKSFFCSHREFPLLSMMLRAAPFPSSSMLESYRLYSVGYNIDTNTIYVKNIKETEWACSIV